jgi:adenylate kinase family enzyme
MQRVVVWGVTGSGKTTFARRLAAILDVPAIELDSLFWNPGWVDTPAEEFQAKVRTALDAAPGGWVSDGNYRGRLGSLAVDRADTLVWLHLPWRVSFWRVLKRTVSRAWTREPLWGGNIESWRLAFFDRNSLLLYSITHHRQAVRGFQSRIAELDAGKQVFELRSRREVEAFLQQLARRPNTVD